ncbi:MAG: sodium:solute symporter family protein [Acidobacteriota bacterium]
MRALDGLILLAFTVYAIGSGIKNRRRASRSLEEYFLAGRTLPGWKAGLSMAATQFAADTPLLVTGIIAVSGIFALWQLWIYALSFLFMGFVLAGSWRRAGVITDAEFTELRYGGRPALILRAVKAIYLGTIFNCTVLAWVFLAGVRIAEPFLLWNRWLPPFLFQPVVHLVRALGVSLTSAAEEPPDLWVRSASNLISIMVILLVTTFYSATGGLRSVVATDVVQIGVMLGGTVLFMAVAVAKAGGLGALHRSVETLFASGGPGGILPDQILAFTPDRARDAAFATLLLFGLQWLIQINADGTGYLAQRSMACRTARDARVAAVVFTFTQILVRSLLWLPLGLALLVLFPPDPSVPGLALQAERESTYVRGMSALLPAGALGLMLTGMFAALASTVDTHINWGASYWANDIYKRLVCEAIRHKPPHPRTLVRVARGSNILIISVSLVVMTRLTSIHQAWQMSLLFGAGMGTVLVLRWIWWRVNAWAEIAAMVSSLAMAPVLLATVNQAALRLLSIAAVSTLAALVAIRWAGPEDRRHLEAFYARVRPPGFWGPIARGQGLPAREGVRQLARALVAASACAGSVFSLLVGIGAWICQAPPPVWFPWPAPWSLLLSGLGLGLIPFWLRRATAAKDGRPGGRRPGWPDPDPA